MPTPDRAAISLRGCRALVTGGVGFIGSHIVDELVRAGAGEILVLDNFVRGPLVPEHAPARKVNPVPRRLADVGEAQRQIGFTSSIALPDGLRRLVAWWQEEQGAKTYAKTR